MLYLLTKKLFLKKMDTCSNGPDKSSTTQLNKHEMCGYSLVTHFSLDEKK